MFQEYAQFFFFLDIIAFLAAFLLNVVKGNRNILRLYFLQSFAVSVVLMAAGILEGAHGLLWVGALTFLIKCVMAPAFFFRILKKYGSSASSTQYLSLPFTLLVLLGLVLLAYSKVFLPLAPLAPEALGSLSLNIAIVFVSIFLIINGRAAFSQIIGILSLENGIVLLAAFVGIEQPLALEMGIIFDIVVWIVIVNAFIGMIYRQFQSLDTRELKHLTEE
ncbi:MAG: hypothetical protein A2808_03015 [Candidatus Moranbacteria bacterium RIFCSPHIGHO2_01_FULL_55_24]|nr:MAG: hypothetical protein A2808_03015 [Candidatus Moranbacteria bacterium RIFCSPHIGHO2_01_FULL_55_24]